MSAVRQDATAERASRDELRIEALQEYQQAVDQGNPPDREEFLDRFSKVADDLADYLDNLNLLRQIAPVFGGQTAVDSLNSSPARIPQLGDFRIIREIGRGGMGVVYEAEQISMSRRVALKVLPFMSILDRRLLQRFHNEARVAGQLVHQHIVPVHAVGCERGVHFYAMQFVVGTSLDDFIATIKSSSANANSATLNGPYKLHTRDSDCNANQRMPFTSTVAEFSTANSCDDMRHIRFAVECTVQAARGLDYAHSQGVIHRDVKPSNLILDPNGKIWITDFGLAQAECHPGVTVTGDLIGTLRYMSPEQAEAQPGIVDHRTDIYSLGLTCYEFLALKPAIDGRDRHELLKQIVVAEPIRPRRLNRSIPVDLETVLLKAMEKVPDDRYSTAGEFADDLQRFLDDQPVCARKPTIAQKVRKWCRRHRAVVGSSLVAFFAVLLCVAIGASVLAVRLGEIVEEEKAMAQQERRLKQRIASLLAESYVDRGQLLCGQGEVAAGMHWMARSLHLAAPDALAIHRVARQNLACWSTRLHQLRSVFWHESRVTAVTFCQADSRVFIGHDNGFAQIWDVATGDSVGPSLRLDARVNTAAYHEETDLIAVGTKHGKVLLLEASTSAPVGKAIQCSDAVRSLAFNRDGTRMLVGTYETVTLLRLDDQYSSTVEQVRDGNAADVRFGSNDEPLALLETKSASELWNVLTNNQVGEAIPNETWGHSAIAPNGRFVACGGGDNILKYWNVTTGELACAPMPHGGDILAVAIDPAGTKLAHAGADGVVLIQDATTGATFGYQLDHTDSVSPSVMEFDPNGSSVVVGGKGRHNQTLENGR